MAWLCVNKSGEEYVFGCKPNKVNGYLYWFTSSMNQGIILPIGTIEKIISKKLTWEDEPVEIKN